jgi:S-phase kinase-associated protein 1
MADNKDVKTEVKAEVKAVAGLDDPAFSRKPITLVSNDAQKFPVEYKFASISTLIKTSLEGDDKADELKLPSVNGNILELIVTYMKEHKGVEPPIIEKPLRSKVMKDVVAHKQDADYIDKIGENRQQLYDLILGANYMDIKSLLHLGCAKVASLVKGQPLEKIKEILDPNYKPSAVDEKKSDEKKSDEKKANDSKEDAKNSVK